MNKKKILIMFSVLVIALLIVMGAIGVVQRDSWMKKTTNVANDGKKVSNKSANPDLAWMNKTTSLEDDWQKEHHKQVNTDEDSTSENVLSISSQDGKYSVYVKEKESEMLYILNNSTNTINTTKIEDAVERSIMSIKWFDNTRVIVEAHINPSLGYLAIYDVSTLEQVVEKFYSLYYIGDTIDSLIYVKPQPHGSQTVGLQEVLDINDNILFRTKENVLISKVEVNAVNGDAAMITELYANDKAKEYNLIFLKKKGKKLRKIRKEKIKNSPVEKIKWIDTEDVKIRQDSKSKIYSSNYYSNPN